jgi:hypothetical protein
MAAAILREPAAYVKRRFQGDISAEIDDERADGAQSISMASCEPSNFAPVEAIRALSAPPKWAGEPIALVEMA